MRKIKILLVWSSVGNAELYNFLPLGLGYLAANLPGNIEVKIWDGILERRPNIGITDELSRYRPELIGLSVWNFNLTAVQEVVGIIKNNIPGSPIVLGGPAVSCYMDKIFNIINADYAIAGEGEIPFRQLSELFANDDIKSENRIKEIDGLLYKKMNGQITCNPPSWGALNELKYCDYEQINLNQYLANSYYYGMHSHAKRTAPVLTTRDCPYPCEFCSARRINGRKVRNRPVHSVIAEIKELHEKYRIDGFNIIDDNFTFNIRYAKQVCREILKLGLKKVSFNSPNGVRMERLDEDLLYLMKQAGWQCLFIAPESGSEQTLKNMRKMVRLPVVREKIRLIRNAGLKVFGFFIIGYPSETVKDIKMTIDFACQNDFDSVVFTCFQPLMGTPVYEKLSASGEIDRPPEGFDYYQISYAPKGLTITQMKFWRFWGLLRFYTSTVERFKNALSNYSLKNILIFLKKIIK